MNRECCAIIPARGGSQGIPGKNLRVVGGRALLAHAIIAARAARRVQRVVVSTDDPALARLASETGAEVVWRPAELASDTASSESALVHALQSLAAGGYAPELVAFLQCTSPLTLPQDIDGTIEALLEQEADTALAVAPFHSFVWRRDGSGAVGVNHDKRVRKRRQDREPAAADFLETGAVYVMKAEGFLRERHRFFGRTALYEMPRERVWEVDEPVDLAVAEVLLRRRDAELRRAQLPADPRALVMDFDGVLTDNRVVVDQDGVEAVRCDRGDGLGLEMLRRTGMRLLVLSKERNPVVAARCAKLRIECLAGVDDKLAALRSWCADQGVALSQLVYVGNDVNDVECMQAAGCGVAVADAHPEARRNARLLLGAPGGRGAVREVCDLLLWREGV